MPVSNSAVMDQIAKGAPQAGAAAAPSPMPEVGTPPTPPGDTGPMSSPMSTPEPKLGNREGALVNLGIALDLIEQSLPSLGSESEEGQKAMMALRALSGLLGPRKKKTNELQDAEIMKMLQTLPRAGGMSPEAKSMGSAPPVPGMQPPGAAMPPPPGGVPGAPPGGQPPMM